MWEKLVIIVGCAALACGSRAGTELSQPAPERDLTAEAVSAEGRREAGVARLVALAGPGLGLANRSLAIRGLGRIGNAAAIEALQRIIADPRDPAWHVAVLALGLNGTDADEMALLAVERSRLDRAGKEALAHALGRVGTERAHAALGELLADPDYNVAQAAALSLGVFGRRKLGLTAALRKQLVELAANDTAGMRYAATYGLAREHEPAADDRLVAAALVSRANDVNEEVRALAVFGLAQRRHADHALFELRLNDRDWRVQVQAVRALAAEWQPEAVRGELGEWLADRWVKMARDERQGPRAHAIVEGLTLLLPSASVSQVRAGALQIVRAGGDREIRCRAIAVVSRTRHEPERLRTCADGQPGHWPEHEQRRLLYAELAATGAAHDAEIAAALAATDAPIRAAALEALAKVDRLPRGALVTALRDPAPVLAGMAAEIAVDRAKTGKPIEPAALDALLARVADEPDPELASSLYDVIGALKMAAGESMRRAALTAPLRPIRARARDCLRALTGVDPGRGEASHPMALPPVDPLALLGKRVTWTVKTSRGDIVIELDPERAAWHVAVVVALTRKRFYDRLTFHRVVPDFVVQGGDPTGTGWGGPGFTVPAEPSALPCTAGRVGIADAGLDTGGSQWFVMHSRAAHLESRYTLIGQVARGQDVADSLRVGDRIESASIEIREPAPEVDAARH